MNKMLSIVVETVKNDRTYMLTLPYMAPYEEVYGVIDEMVADLKQHEQDMIAAVAEQKAKEQQQSQPITVKAEPVKEK